MRYNRPSSAKGSATNRSAVSSGRFEIAGRHPGATDVQLAGNADRAQPAGPDPRCDTPCWRSADRSAPDRSSSARDAMDRRPDRRLGRSEHVPHLAAAGDESIGELPGHRLAATQHLQASDDRSSPTRTTSSTSSASPARRSRRACRSGRRGRGRRRPRRATRRRAAAGDQRQEHLQHGDVERQRRHRHQHVGAGEPGTRPASTSGS